MSDSKMNRETCLDKEEQLNISANVNGRASEERYQIKKEENRKEIEKTNDIIAVFVIIIAIIFFILILMYH